MKASHVRPYVAALALVVAMPATAQPSPQAKAQAEEEAAWAAARKTAIIGPADIKLDDQAHLKIAPDQVFIPSAEANRIMTAMGNASIPGRKGLVIGRKEDASWIVDVDWVGEGYVEDDEAKKWNADELLQGLKDGTEADNEARVARGLPALDVLGWVEPPAYDPRAHRLVWSLSLQDRGGPANAPHTINYNTYALGREGYFTLDLITGADKIAKDKAVARDLLASLNYAPGKRYEDFNGSTDKVAAYGLGALVGVVAAKKVGLLAAIGLFLVKAWKLALLGLAGIGAAARRFFRRGREEEGEA